MGSLWRQQWWWRWLRGWNLIAFFNFSSCKKEKSFKKCNFLRNSHFKLKSCKWHLIKSLLFFMTGKVIKVWVLKKRETGLEWEKVQVWRAEIPFDMCVYEWWGTMKNFTSQSFHIFFPHEWSSVWSYIKLLFIIPLFKENWRECWWQERNFLDLLRISSLKLDVTARKTNS